MMCTFVIISSFFITSQKKNIYRKNQKSTLKIDGGQTASARSRGRQKILNIDTGLYIGMNYMLLKY